MTIELNDEFKEAFDLIAKTNENVFVTGNAGAGKTTFLKYYIEQAKKNTVILAPTGIAALNAGGETVHSFFKFKPDIMLHKVKKKKLTEKSIYHKVETIIIDEASMLRCDLLDCAEKFLRLNRQIRKPFGGVQMVFIGDLKQLPPVVKEDEKEFFSTVYDTPYFLGAKCLQDRPIKTIELKKIYRQSDIDFIKLLNSVRDRSIAQDGIKKLNERVSSDVEIKDMAVYLATTNRKAASINEHHLKQIKALPYEFCAETENIEEKSAAFPADNVLTVKKGAQVMMLNNDSRGRWVNGSMAIIEDIRLAVESDRVLIYVKFPNGSLEPVEPYKWELFKYRWNEKSKRVETESAGSFRQFPLKLSWAITIHKSQGKTFENVIIDMERGAFAAGQLYVALSRCKTFEGIRLLRPISHKDL